jgi:hypothetical protein
MRDRLPAPDPFEPSGSPPRLQISAPTTMFLRGRPTPQLDRVADAIQAARPGLLVVCVNC